MTPRKMGREICHAAFFWRQTQRRLTFRATPHFNPGLLHGDGGGANLNLSSLVGLACRLMGTGWAEFAQGQRDGLIRVKLSLMAGGCE